MAIIGLKRKYGRVTINLFGLKLSFRFQIDKKSQNKYISLGENCFVRKILSKNGIKPKRRDGELSFPFDLAINSLPSIAQILSNDFANFYEGLAYSDKDRKMWINEEYNIQYLHDHFDEDEKDKFVKRYDKRIENLRNLPKSDKKITFISVFLGSDAGTDDLNSIYRYLKNLFNDKEFVYLVFNFQKGNMGIDSIENLDSGIFYYEHPAPFTDFRPYWYDPKFRETAEWLDFEAKFINLVKMHD